ncbi:MAG: glutamate mutase L [Anaerovoracaceae bacterium]
MKIDALVAEIGSTTTVVNAFTDLSTDNPVFWGQGQAPTSVMEGDVRIGLNGAVEDLKKNAISKGKLTADEDFEYEEMLATSSAAGGLKMTVHGLVYDMTAKAAKEAALGAGAIIHYITAGKLRRTDLIKIKDIKPNLILLAGGVDYGERDTAIYNAELIESLKLGIPLIYAGNVENQEEIRLIFEEPLTGEAHTKLYIEENVYPKIDDLNVEPCRKVIQDAFEDHIIHAPGMEHVRDMVNGPIVPTPGAVMECTKLMSEFLGNVITLDVGGATTDLHSVTEDSDYISRLLISPEPKAKRTVEGDLGVFVNRDKVIESIGEEEYYKRLSRELAILRSGKEANEMTEDEIKEAAKNITIEEMDAILDEYKAIPKNEEELVLVEILTKEAVIRAVERHAGSIRYIYGPEGRSTVAQGKDLTQVTSIVGTGGALTRLPGRVKMMEEIAKHNESGLLLFPGEHAKILVDNDYIMASLGVLSKRYPEAATILLKKSLHI